MFAMLVFISASPAYAQAQDNKKVQYMVYDVYASGFHVLQANLMVDSAAKDRYALTMEASTFGFLGKLAPWKGFYQSYGWLENNKIMPERHQSVTTWKGEEEVYTYNYAKSGKFKSYVIKEHNKEERTEEVAEELTYQTTDSLTATLRILRDIAAGKTCDGESDVFDGKRRFAQVFRDQGEAQLEASKYNIFGGTARECTVEVIPKGGKWHDKPRGWLSIQEQGRDRGMMPTVWIANVSENAPAVPVKVRVKTAYGTLFMHLAEYRYGDQVIVSGKRGG